MIKLNKTILFALVLSLQAITASSQDVLLKAMNGFNDLTESVEKLYNLFKNVDSGINKDKAQRMAADLYKNVGDVILAKEAVVYKLKNDSTEVPEFRSEIQKLEEKLSALSSTLEKYDDLIGATGIETQQLAFALREDFLQKAQTLNTAKNLMRGNISDAEAKEQLLIHFRSCINILKNTQATLAKFKA